MGLLNDAVLIIVVVLVVIVVIALIRTFFTTSNVVIREGMTLDEYIQMLNDKGLPVDDRAIERYYNNKIPRNLP